MIKNLLKSFETRLVEWIVGSFFTVLSVGIAFYFNATHIMAQNTADIKEVKSIVKTIDKTPTLNTLKIHQVRTEMSEVKEDVKELNKDFKDFQKEYRTDKDRIIELLMKIKDEK